MAYIPHVNIRNENNRVIVKKKPVMYISVRSRSVLNMLTHHRLGHCYQKAYRTPAAHSQKMTKHGGAALPKTAYSDQKDKTHPESKVLVIASDTRVLRPLICGIGTGTAGKG